MEAPTASQTIGPFFRHALDRPAWSNLSAAGARGEAIRVIGRVFDGAHESVPDGMIEIWQADGSGEYWRPERSGEATAERKFRGFGRATTDSEGRFTFVTVKPGGVPGAGGAKAAPHINVTLFARGLLRALNTRIYFADCAAENAADPLLSMLALPERQTLIAQRADDAASVATYHFDIYLQGERETVFLEI